MTSKKWIIYFFVFLPIVAGIIGLFNYTIDPYGFRTGYTYSDARINKPYAVAALQPATIIIGNSRNYYSFEPANTKLVNAYNLSLPGIGIAPIRKLFEHSVNTSNIHKAIISLDNICDPDIKSINKYEVDSRFLVNSNNSQSAVFINKVLLYFLIDTTKSSFRLLIHKSPTSRINRNGRRPIFNESGFATVGYAIPLINRDKSLIISRLKSKQKPPRSYEEYKGSCKTSNFEKIIKIANENNINVSFFINPRNIRYWEIDQQIKHTNNTKLYSKRLIQDIIQSIPPEQRMNFSGFDFLKLNSYTTEKLSSTDSSTVPEYWYESSHYQLGFGDIILNAIVDNDFSNGELVSNIKTEDFEKSFVVQQSFLSEWEKVNPSIVLEITDAIDKQLKLSD